MTEAGSDDGGNPVIFTHVVLQVLVLGALGEHLLEAIFLGSKDECIQVQVPTLGQAPEGTRGVGVGGESHGPDIPEGVGLEGAEREAIFGLAPLILDSSEAEAGAGDVPTLQAHGQVTAERGVGEIKLVGQTGGVFLHPKRPGTVATEHKVRVMIEEGPDVGFLQCLGEGAGCDALHEATQILTIRIELGGVTSGSEDATFGSELYRT